MFYKDKKNAKKKGCCERCGSFLWIDYSVNEYIRKKVLGDENSNFCLNCFVEVAANKGIRIGIRIGIDDIDFISID